MKKPPKPAAPPPRNPAEHYCPEGPPEQQLPRPDGCIPDPEGYPAVATYHRRRASIAETPGERVAVPSGIS